MLIQAAAGTAASDPDYRVALIGLAGALIGALAGMGGHFLTHTLRSHAEYRAHLKGVFRQWREALWESRYVDTRLAANPTDPDELKALRERAILVSKSLHALRDDIGADAPAVAGKWAPLADRPDSDALSGKVYDLMVTSKTSMLWRKRRWAQIKFWANLCIHRKQLENARDEGNPQNPESP